MALAMLILQFLLAIPKLIALIHEIMDIIHSLRGQEKQEAQKDLRCILQKHLKGGCMDHDGAESELLVLHENLKNKYGK